MPTVPSVGWAESQIFFKKEYKFDAHAYNYKSTVNAFSVFRNARVYLMDSETELVLAVAVARENWSW